MLKSTKGGVGDTLASEFCLIFPYYTAVWKYAEKLLELSKDVVLDVDLKHNCSKASVNILSLGLGCYQRGVAHLQLSVNLTTYMLWLERWGGGGDKNMNISSEEKLFVSIKNI